MTGLGGHEFVVDEKSQHGGNDLGPNPLEYLLGALAGKVFSTFMAYAVFERLRASNCILC